MSNEGLGFRV